MREEIRFMLNELLSGPLSTEERAVMSLLASKWAEEGRKRVTQTDIAKSEPWLGSVAKYEKVHTPETTLRKVRQIVRDLRIKRNAPILSDRDGYWIPKDELEVNNYLAHLEMMAKLQTKAWFETYNAMQKVFGVRSEYFEKQPLTLFS